MRYIVSASLVVIIACVAISARLPLSLEDNGYSWNSSDVNKRLALCKRMVSVFGKNERWWLKALNTFYESTQPQALNRLVAYVAEDLLVIQSPEFAKLYIEDLKNPMEYSEPYAPGIWEKGCLIVVTYYGNLIKRKRSADAFWNRKSSKK